MGECDGTTLGDAHHRVALLLLLLCSEGDVDVGVVVPEVRCLRGRLFWRDLGEVRWEGTPSAEVVESLSSKVREAASDVDGRGDGVVVVLDEVEVARPEVELRVVREGRVRGEAPLVDGGDVVPDDAVPFVVDLGHLQLDPRDPQLPARRRLTQRVVEGAPRGVEVSEDADLEAGAVRGDEVAAATVVVVVFVLVVKIPPLEDVPVGVEGRGVVALASFEVRRRHGGGALEFLGVAPALFVVIIVLVVFPFGGDEPPRAFVDGGVDLPRVVDAADEFEEVGEGL
mmetsp:Transcript_29065/g.93721  ORF Transcript_29065/g.93721 Transcript_29065/m.93721 type:complete len:284 (-) Transcript_29065:1098-1949(-)